MPVIYPTMNKEWKKTHFKAAALKPQKFIKKSFSFQAPMEKIQSAFNVRI